MLVYRILIIIASPFLFLYFLLKSIKYGEFLRCFERLGFPSIKPRNGRYIWIHAVSVGEVNSILEFAKYVKKLNPEFEIVITTGTPTGANIVISNGFMHQYMPIDIGLFDKFFLKSWHPEVVMFVDSEIWPNMINLLSKKKIPTILVNARLSDKAFANWKKFAKFFKSLLSKYTLILAQSQSDYAKYSFFKTKNVVEINNLKYSLPVKSYNYKKPQRPIFVAASTHNGEEKIAINVHKTLTKKYPGLLTIIIPRHPERVVEIRPLLKDIKYAVRTESREIPQDAGVYLVNTFGELGLFYSMADIAFVGGSLVGVGGHNIFEAAVQKCAVVHGNYMSNFADMAEYFSAVMYQVSCEDELADVIDSLLSDHSTLEYIKEQTFNLSQELNKNVVHSAYSLIKQHVKDSKVLV